MVIWKVECSFVGGTYVSEPGSGQLVVVAFSDGVVGFVRQVENQLS
jgi:hypothetical protein